MRCPFPYCLPPHCPQGEAGAVQPCVHAVEVRKGTVCLHVHSKRDEKNEEMKIICSMAMLFSQPCHHRE